MKENGSPPPEFRTDDDHSFFATVLPIHPDAKAAASDLRGSLRSETPQVDAVVAALEGEMARKDLQDALGLADREPRVYAVAEANSGSGSPQRTVRPES